MVKFTTFVFCSLSITGCNKKKNHLALFSCFKLIFSHYKYKPLNMFEHLAEQIADCAIARQAVGVPLDH